MVKDNKFKLNTPVLFIVFNRPEATQKVFEEIRRAKPKELFIAADGARSNRPNEKKICEKVRKIVSEVDWPCKVKTLFRDKNLGCKHAVSGAIDWFFTHVEQGIILEDDCLPNQSFFRFCQELLMKYKNDSRIMHISGTNVNNVTPIEESYFFAINYNVWGWATWKRAWALYDLDMKLWPKFKNERWMRYFTRSRFEELQSTMNMDKLYGGKLDTWDYQWWFTCVTNSSLAIIPKVNLIENIGFQTGTHMNVNDKSKALKRNEIKFPIKNNPFVINRRVYQIDAAKFFYKGRIRRKLLKLLKIK